MNKKDIELLNEVYNKPVIKEESGALPTGKIGAMAQRGVEELGEPDPDINDRTYRIENVGSSEYSVQFSPGIQPGTTSEGLIVKGHGVLIIKSMLEELGYVEEDIEEPEDDYEDDMTDVEADADTLASAGYGTDEDYGHFGGDDY